MERQGNPAQNRWSPTEDSILQKHYPTMDFYLLCSRLPNRIPVAIRARASKLGLKKRGWEEVRQVRKTLITLRLDDDILGWFRQEPGYQSRIRAILRATVFKKEDHTWTSTSGRKTVICMRLDDDILERLRQQPRYQTRINAILRAHYKKAQKTEQASA